MCEGLRSQLKQAQTEASGLRGKVSKYEATIAEKDTIIQNIKNDLNTRSKECGDLKETNRILQRNNEQL